MLKEKLLAFSFSLALCAFSFTLICGCRNKPLYNDTCAMMGTFVQVISPDKNAHRIVFKEFTRLDKLLSKYNPDSEVSRLNRSGKLKVSPDTFYIIKKSREFYRLSNGAFDITVGPLVDLWGFTDKKYRVPTEKEINQTLTSIGSDKIILNEIDNVIEFKNSQIKIDLGGIAKGYAIDCALKKLKENNIKSCLINAGGQVYGLGKRFGLPWKISLRNLGSTYLELKDQSVSTSGNYEQYFIKDNKYYTHIINPVSGRPVDTEIASVTVVTADGLSADALSTAIFVLGKDKGSDLAKRLKVDRVEFLDKK